MATVARASFPSLRIGVRRMCMLPRGAELGSSQADRALDRDLVYIYIFLSRSLSAEFFPFSKGYDTVSQPDSAWIPRS